jgi:hypothetical protein
MRFFMPSGSTSNRGRKRLKKAKNPRIAPILVQFPIISNTRYPSRRWKSSYEISLNPCRSLCYFLTVQ